MKYINCLDRFKVNIMYLKYTKYLQINKINYENTLKINLKIQERPEVTLLCSRFGVYYY